MKGLSAASHLALAAVLLAACSRNPTDAAASAAASGGPAPTASAAPAAGQPAPAAPARLVPTARAGYWRVTQTSPGRPPHVMLRCENGKPTSLKMGKGCPDMSLRHTAQGGMVMDGRCSDGPSAMTLHIVTRGDLNSHYTLDAVIATQMDPGRPDRVVKTHTVGVYLGPCPAGTTTPGG